MKFVIASILIIAVIGALPGYAQEEDAIDLASVHATPGGESDWNSSAAARSLLLPQINAVYSALNDKLAADRPPNVVTAQVELDDDDTPSTRDGNCRHMAETGSRFMKRRCFYTSESEAAFNNYQFQTEIEMLREQRDLFFLEEAEYSLAYRRYLKDQN